MAPLPTADLAALLPVAILTAGALVLIMTEVFLTSGRRGYQAGLTVATAALAAISAAGMKPPGRIFAGQAVVDAFSVFITVTVCGGVALSALVGAPWLRAREAERGEFYALTLFSAAGMSLLGSSSDLLVAFISIEVMSLATYALAAWMRRGRKPAEAAFKYFLLGAFSSALLLFGSALVFGATGSTLFSEIGRGSGPLLAVGLGLVGAGLAFKVAAVPFHLWTPDVYEGAPTPVTAFMAAGVKTAAFAVLTRLLVVVWGAAGLDAPRFGAVVSALAVLTMVFGNLLALPQRSVKRMLAYSSIGHAGYLLVGVVSAGASGAREVALSSVLFYLAAYTATVIGAFAVVGAVERRGGFGEEPTDAWDLARLAGLGRRHPGLAFVMAVFMLSLAGVPPTAGFIGKLLVFKAAISAQAYGLAVVGMLTSGLGAYYYLRVVVYLYMRSPEGAAGLEEPATSPVLSFALVAAAVAVVLLGVGPEPIAALARAASAAAP